MHLVQQRALARGEARRAPALRDRCATSARRAAGRAVARHAEVDQRIDAPSIGRERRRRRRSRRHPSITQRVEHQRAPPRSRDAGGASRQRRRSSPVGRRSVSVRRRPSSGDAEPAHRRRPGPAAPAAELEFERLAAACIARSASAGVASRLLGRRQQSRAAPRCARRPAATTRTRRPRCAQRGEQRGDERRAVVRVKSRSRSSARAERSQSRRATACRWHGMHVGVTPRPGRDLGSARLDVSGSRSQPSFSSLSVWIAIAFALASRSGSAWYSQTQQRNSL